MLISPMFFTFLDQPCSLPLRAGTINSLYDKVRVRLPEATAERARSSATSFRCEPRTCASGIGMYQPSAATGGGAKVNGAAFKSSFPRTKTLQLRRARVIPL